MNPYLLLAALLALGGAFAGGTWFGIDYQQKRYAEEELARKSGWADALESTAKELAKLKVVNQTRNITLEREIVEKRVYQDCKHSPESVRVLNDALKGGAK
jgi:hypothetical protein